jgi:site-specific DNA recombinase
VIAAIYARKSTEQNGVADEQKSVSRQIEHARAYAERKGWVIAEDCIFVDDGISGAEFAKRPGLVRLLNALKPRPAFSVLVMSEESRLGRESIETGYAFKQIVSAGVRVFFYMEDRERTLDSPIDKIMMQLTAFADELEREKARQRTYDAMLRKAKARHVTGGRVFGYDNVDVLTSDVDSSGRPVRSHVIRQINPAEADVVREIFRLCALGMGKAAIAKHLNDAGARCPRAQQQRRVGWAPSSVREVLYRELYRGLVIWNRTRTRTVNGSMKQAPVPEAEWIKTPAPELRIVTDAAWTAAHERLANTRDTYLRTQKGRLWGRPLNGIAAKYLGTGLLKCGQCGSTLEVRSRSHGRRRAFYYSCSAFNRKGAAVCRNNTDVPMERADSAILTMLERELLDPEVLREAVARVRTLARGRGQSAEARRTEITTAIAKVDAELVNLTGALASGLSSVIDGIRDREKLRTSLTRELETLDSRQTVAGLDPRIVDRKIDKAIREWQQTIRTHIPQARQMIRKLLKDRITFTPETDANGKRGWSYRADGSVSKLLPGVISELSELPQAVASPTGFEPVFWP